MVRRTNWDRSGVFIFPSRPFAPGHPTLVHSGGHHMLPTNKKQQRSLVEDALRQGRPPAVCTFLGVGSEVDPDHAGAV